MQQLPHQPSPLVEQSTLLNKPPPVEQSTLLSKPPPVEQATLLSRHPLVEQPTQSVKQPPQHKPGAFFPPCAVTNTEQPLSQQSSLLSPVLPSPCFTVTEPLPLYVYTMYAHKLFALIIYVSHVHLQTSTSRAGYSPLQTSTVEQPTLLSRHPLVEQPLLPTPRSVKQPPQHKPAFFPPRTVTVTE